MAASVRMRDPAVADEELVERVCAGDRAAFDCLYEVYFPRVYAFVARRIDNRADVEETVQEVFLGAFSGIESFRREGAFVAWILGVARRTVAGRFKRKRHPTVPLDEGSETQALGLLAPTIRREPTPLEHYECGERLGRITAAARDLSAEQQRMVELHHLEQLPIQEIAARFAKSEDSIKSTLYRARRALLSR